MITQDQLKEVLHYCPETGVFTWLAGGSGRSGKGAVAGGFKTNGRSGKSYGRIMIRGCYYLMHRLAFLYMTGEFPEDQVDHEDGNGCNNVWSNLQAATRGENAKNKRRQVNNTSGVVGVTWDKRSCLWCAYLDHNKCHEHLGYFRNKEDAIAARKAAEVLYGFHKNHGSERPL